MAYSTHLISQTISRHFRAAISQSLKIPRTKGCVPFRWSGLGWVIRDRANHGAHLKNRWLPSRGGFVGSINVRSDPSDLGSLILIRTIPMECTIKFLGLPLKESRVLLPERNGRIFSAWDSSSNNACLASLLWKTRWFHHRRYTSWTILYNKVKTFTIKFDSPYTYQRALDSRTRTTTSTKFSQY